MIHIQYGKYGALSGLLLFCTIMLGTTEGNQNSVFAQITPSPEKFGSDESSPNSSPHTHGSNDGDEGSTGSSGSSDDTKLDETAEEEEESTTSTQLDESTEQPEQNNGDLNTTGEQDDETITTEEQDPDPTNQLVKAIMNEVNEGLSASGITGP